MPEEFAGSIYELGIFSQSTNSLAGGYGSRMLLSFESIDEGWTNATWSSLNSRYGAEAMVVSPDR